MIGQSTVERSDLITLLTRGLGSIDRFEIAGILRGEINRRTMRRRVEEETVH